jgi:hypothetical protein
MAFDASVCPVIGQSNSVNEQGDQDNDRNRNAEKKQKQ